MPRKIMSPPSFQQEEHYLHPNPHPNHHLYQRLPHPVKHETKAVTTTIMTPSSLKVNKDSHVIKKQPSSSGTVNSSSPTSGSNSTNKSNQQQQQQQQQQRGPVIIYTHSPKVIHTNPRDFMSLVQKLTGMSKNDEAGTNSKQPESSSVPNNNVGNLEEGSRCTDVSNSNNNNNNNNYNNNSTEDNESSSITTDENCSSSGNNTTGGDVVGQFNPYMSPQLFDLLPPPPPPLTLPSPPSSNLPPLYMQSSSDVLCYGGDPTIYDYVDVNFPYDQIT